MLKKLGLYVTYRCRYRCGFCEFYSIRQHLQTRDTEFRELETEEIRRILSEARTYGVPYVILTGGEPFARHDIYDIIDHCCSIRLPFGINTRHTFTAQEALRIADVGNLGHLWVSIDSHDAATASELSGRTGWFEEYVQGIRLLVDAGVALSSFSVVTTRNARALDDLFGFLADLGIAQVVLREVALPTCLAARYARFDYARGKDLLLSDDDRDAVDKAVRRWGSRLNFAADPDSEGPPPAAPLTDRPLEDLPRVCDLLNGELLVRPDGKAIYCGLAHDIVVGDLRQSSVREVVEGAALQRLCDPPRDVFENTDCSACGVFDLCTRVGRCYKRTLAAHGEYFAPDPKLCARFRGSTVVHEALA